MVRLWRIPLKNSGDWSRSATSEPARASAGSVVAFRGAMANQSVAKGFGSEFFNNIGAQPPSFEANSPDRFPRYFRRSSGLVTGGVTPGVT
jgi:hypothetical protein